MQVDGFEEPP